MKLYRWRRKKNDSSLLHGKHLRSFFYGFVMRYLCVQVLCVDETSLCFIWVCFEYFSVECSATWCHSLDLCWLGAVKGATSATETLEWTVRKLLKVPTARRLQNRSHDSLRIRCDGSAGRNVSHRLKNSCSHATNTLAHTHTWAPHKYENCNNNLFTFLCRRKGENNGKYVSEGDGGGGGSGVAPKRFLTICD